MRQGGNSDAPRPDKTDAGQETTEDTSRREALARLGRFAYVAPALMLLAEPGLAHAAYGPPRPSTGSIPHRP